jgi:tetratricopeptide (TPR) repeat protein
MKKTLPVILVASLFFAVYSGLSHAENVISVSDVDEGDKIGAVNKQGTLSETDQVEQNVSDMLKLLEDLENDESFGVKLKITEDEKSKPGEADPLDQFIKPDAPSSLTQSSPTKNKTKNNIEAADEVVKLAPDDPDSHFRLGLKYWRSKNPDEAIRHFKEVLRLAPENAHAYWNLGLLHEEKKDNTQAVDYIKQAEAIYLKYGYPTYAEEAKKYLESLSIKNANSSVSTPLPE